MREFPIYPSPLRTGYLGSDELNPANRITYAARVYSATNKPAAWEAQATGTTNYLALESVGTDHLQVEGTTDVLLLESSSPTTQSIIYIFQNYSPSLLSGVSTGKSSGSDLVDLSVAFPKNYFDAGNLLTFQISGKFTANLANTYVTFTTTFPDSGTSSTVTTPSTVTQDALGDFELQIYTRLGYNTSNQGVATNTGRLTVANTDASTGESTSLITSVENTFSYEDVIYFKPQVQWSSASAGNSVSFYSVTLTIT